MVKIQHGMGTISFKCSMLVFILLVISSIEFISKILRKYFVERGINACTNISEIFIVIMLIQMHMFQEELIGGIGQVRRTCPHLFSE